MLTICDICKATIPIILQSYAFPLHRHNMTRPPSHGLMGPRPEVSTTKVTR